MSHKVNPIALRVGYTKNWRYHWFISPNEVNSQLKTGGIILTNNKLVAYILKHVPTAYDVHIQRTYRSIKLSIWVERKSQVKTPVLEKLSAYLHKILELENFSIDLVEDIRKLANAAYICYLIKEQILRRENYKKVIYKILTLTKENGVEGIKILIKGRLNGAEIARAEKFHYGKLPLSTLRADIDYYYTPINMYYGIVGVKVYIYRGMVYDNHIKGIFTQI